MESRNTQKKTFAGNMTKKNICKQIRIMESRNTVANCKNTVDRIMEKTVAKNGYIGVEK